jgi:hypothetical protein
MDKFTLARALQSRLQQSPDRDVRVEETNEDTRILDDSELVLAAGGEEVPTW